MKLKSTHSASIRQAQDKSSGSLTSEGWEERFDKKYPYGASKDVIKKILREEIKKAKREVLEELINIFKDREPLETYTTNVILLEFKGRLMRLEEK